VIERGGSIHFRCSVVKAVDVVACVELRHFSCAGLVDRRVVRGGRVQFLVERGLLGWERDDVEFFGENSIPINCFGFAARDAVNCVVDSIYIWFGVGVWVVREVNDVSWCCCCIILNDVSVFFGCHCLRVFRYAWDLGDDEKGHICVVWGLGFDGAFQFSLEIKMGRLEVYS